MRKRTLARDWALRILYQAEINGQKVEETAEKCWMEEEAEEVEEEIRQFALRLVLGVEQNLEPIDEKISSYATNWQLKRMAVIDRNILRLGVFELKYANDIPPKVTINEMVELAKRYGDLESSKFVNGILDKIHKTEIDPSGKAQ